MDGRTVTEQQVFVFLVRFDSAGVLFYNADAVINGMALITGQAAHFLRAACMFSIMANPNMKVVFRGPVRQDKRLRYLLAIRRQAGLQKYPDG